MPEATDGLGECLVEALRQVSPRSAKKLSRDEAQAVVEAVLEDAVAQRWIAEQMSQISIRSAEYRDGVTQMDLEPARELLALWVGAARGLIGEGPNYSETVLTDRVDHLAHTGAKLEMGVKVAESPDKYIITVQREAFNTITPHEARRQAEKQRDDLNAAVWEWICAVNDGAGFDADDLGWKITRMGFEPPPEED
jgi:hypothetical protein